MNYIIIKTKYIYNNAVSTVEMKIKYTNIHTKMNIHTCLKARSLVFTVTLLSAATLQLVAAIVILFLSARGLYDYRSAVLYVPVLIESAALSAVLSVGGGLCVDLILRGK